MIILKNTSKKDCIKSLKDYIDNETRNYSICLIGKLGYESFDYNPTEIKKEFKKVKSKLKFDLHEIIEDIDDKLSNYWFWIIKNPEQESVFKLNVLIEYLQMRKYHNPGIDFDNPDNKTMVVLHLKDDKTEDIHCQIVAITSLHPEHPNFKENLPLYLSAFLRSHSGQSVL